jgi:hypothetical protein
MTSPSSCDRYIAWHDLTGVWRISYSGHEYLSTKGITDAFAPHQGIVSIESSCPTG